MPTPLSTKMKRSLSLHNKSSSEAVHTKTKKLRKMNPRYEIPEPIERDKDEDSANEKDEETYEKTPRHQRWWSAVTSKEYSLPVIDPTSGQVTMKEVVGSETKTSKEQPPEADNKEEGMSRKKRQLLAEMRKSREKFAKKQSIVKPLPNEDLKRHELMKQELVEASTSELKMKLIKDTLETIMTIPENEFYRLQLIIWIYDAARLSKDTSVKLAALLAMGYLYKDIIPPYKIKENTEGQIGGGVDDTVRKESGYAPDGTRYSKRYRKVRKYEMTLLKFYKEFLVKIVKPVSLKHPQIIIPIVCDLMYTSPQFNYHKEILLPLCIKFCTYPDNTACEYLASTWSITRELLSPITPIVNVSNCCLDCLRSIIACDATLDYTCDIVTAIGVWARNAHKMQEQWSSTNEPVVATTSSLDKKATSDIHITDSSYQHLGDVSRFYLAGRLLQMIGSIDLRKKEAPVEAQARLLRGDMSDKAWKLKTAAVNAKRKGKGDNDDEDIKAARAWGVSRVHPDLKRFRKNEADVLREIFVVYLRIIRSSHIYIIARKFAIVEGVLCGLSRLALRVNVELVSEISNELKNLLTVNDNTSQQSRPPLPPAIGLFAVKCGLSLLQVEGSALQVDMSWLCDALTSSIEKSLPLLIGNSDISSINNEDIDNTSNTITPTSVMSCYSNDIQSTYSIMSSDLFADSLVSCIDDLLNCVQIMGHGAMGMHSVGSIASLVGLTSALVNVAANADPSISSKIFKKVEFLISKFPKLKSLIDSEGIVISCVEDAVSIFWQKSLVGSQIDKRQIGKRKTIF